ncbi:hypothetical protein [Rhodococcus sp. 3A]|uniref:hypothetical protein n=1 Tax=Rhodococcus sp. 3A TaxID=2834581 RepID=UPI00163AB1E3|nr:hypothetical protein [Rhodococcus sp. 3A]MBC2644628.1 hypothetical protein [Rhodococcus sp. 3A]
MDLSVFVDSARHDTRPLLTPSDRWGTRPFPDRVVRAVHCEHRLCPPDRAGSRSSAASARRRPEAAQARSAAGLNTFDIELDQGYNDRSIHARRDAHTHFEGVADILDSIENEADKLLADLRHSRSTRTQEMTGRSKDRR